MSKYEVYSPTEISQRALLQLEGFSRRSDDNSTGTSPSSISATNSPSATFVRERSASQEADFLDNDDEREPASGPHRSTSVSSLKSDREKRKRSRVTPEQLVHLEAIFATDRSPTASRRKAISESLGMHERQTQIWFQNRRAKAKIQDGKQKGRSASLEAPPDTPPELSTGFEVDLHNLIHEDERKEQYHPLLPMILKQGSTLHLRSPAVTIIPCTDLTIGTWRRIATTMGKYDLVAYVCEVKRCLTWFIQSGGFGFKMEIPFDTIIDTEFRNEAPASGTATFLLSEPPMFFLENVSSPLPDGSVNRSWKRCSDWTEGQQATRVLQHTLVGSAVQLAHLLRNLRTSASASEVPVSLHPPSYHTTNTPTSPIDLSASVSPLQGSGYHHASTALDFSSSHRPDVSQRESSLRSIAPSAFETRYSPLDSRRPSLRHHSSFISRREHPYSPITRRHSSTNVPASTFDEYHGDSHQSASPSEYNSLPVTHSHATQPYGAQTISTVPPYSDTRGVQVHEIDASQRSTSAQHFGQPGFEASPTSPPILTSPYYPPPHLAEHHPPDVQSSHNVAAPSPITSDFPSILYESRGELNYPHKS